MKKVLTLALILFVFQIKAQTIVKSSIDSGGASTTLENIHVLYTIGEVAIAEKSIDGIVLSEGFINSSCFCPTLSNEDLELFQEFVLYPNPTFGELNVNGDLTEIENIEIYSVLGKKLMSLNSDFKQIDVSSLSSSIFFVRIINEKGSKTFKILKR